MLSRVWLGAVFLSIGGAVVAFSGCVGDDPIEITPSGDGGNDTTPGKKDLGAGCATADECASGNCVDALCCDTACSGVCESCKLPGSTGHCTPVPSGQDPDQECKPLDPLESDAGTPEDDGGGGEQDGGVNLPDGGVSGVSALCAGSCNGARACAFPGTEKTCGTTFCNDSTQAGRLSCDGRGNCSSVVLDACPAYVCDPAADGGACKQKCSAQEDCQPTHYCNANGDCVAKKGNGTQCGLPNECTSGFCNGDNSTNAPKVCCDTDCNQASTSCISNGNVGKCVCPECATGPCKLYYRDADGDTFGDKAGTIGNGNAKYGCAAGPAPVGFVDNNKDCYDVADVNGPKVKPTQTGYFDTGYGPGNTNYDYDCNGGISKYYAEAPGAVCHYCSIIRDAQTGLQYCSGESSKCSSTATLSGHACGGTFSFSCDETKSTAFRTTVGCGVPSTLYYCGKCSAVGGTPSVSSAPSTKQRCR